MKTLPVQLRAARREDLDAIVALDRATELAPHWPVTAYTAILNVTCADPERLPQRCLIVAEHLLVEGATHPPPLVGVAVGLVHPAPPQDAGPCLAELEDVVVAAHCRRAGIGRALCAAVLDWCRSQGATEAVLEVRAANAAAIALYTQLGFEQAGLRPGYYRDPEDDAVTMLLRFGESC
jgi:[ribosomal protein S18]-alanine N-acetyltransferase